MLLFGDSKECGFVSTGLSCNGEHEGGSDRVTGHQREAEIKSEGFGLC